MAPRFGKFGREKIFFLFFYILKFSPKKIKWVGYSSVREKNFFFFLREIFNILKFVFFLFS